MSPAVGLADALSGSLRLNHALGALGELRGEVTVWDDQVYLADAGDDVRFSVTARHEVDEARDATMLFGAAVTAWEAVPLAGGGDLGDLERALDAWQRERNLDAALAFRVVDPSATAAWHVIDGERLPEGVSSCDQRKDYAHQFESLEQPLRVVGIYTTKHTGIVVDHTTSIHAHLITDDDRTGHLDDLLLSASSRVEVGVRQPR